LADEAHPPIPLWDCLASGAADVTPETSSADEAAIPQFRHKGIRVLLVEDIPVSLEVCVAILEGLGCVSKPLRWLGCFAAHANGSFGLIFMDCQMPEMDGYEAPPKYADANPNRIATLR